MPASDHVNPYQMKLFMQAKELIDIPSHEGSGYKSLGRDDDLYKYKLEESKQDWDAYEMSHGLADAPDPDAESLYDSIQQKGVQKPVALRLEQVNVGNLSVYKPHLTNGNHRVSAAYDINPEMWLPVTYTDRMFHDD